MSVELTISGQNDDQLARLSSFIVLFTTLLCKEVRWALAIEGELGKNLVVSEYQARDLPRWESSAKIW